MTLTINIINTEYKWTSSYEAINAKRKYIINCSLKLLEQIPNHKTNYLKSILNKWIEIPKYTNQDDFIDYNLITTQYNDTVLFSYLTEFNLIGLYWFINHSFYEGVLSQGQCVDIYNTFNTIQQYLNLNWSKDLFLLFKKCVELHTYIIFY